VSKTNQGILVTPQWRVWSEYSPPLPPKFRGLCRWGVWVDDGGVGFDMWTYVFFKWILLFSFLLLFWTLSNYLVSLIYYTISNQFNIQIELEIKGERRKENLWQNLATIWTIWTSQKVQIVPKFIIAVVVGVLEMCIDWLITKNSLI
jgi:hypothetical protein